MGQRCVAPYSERESRVRRGVAVVLVALLTTAPRLAKAQPVPSSDADMPSFWSDIVYFRADSGATTFAELFVEVPYSSLTFVRKSAAPGTTAADEVAGYEAAVEIGAVFDDESGFQVCGQTHSDRVYAPDFATTISQSKTLLCYFSFQGDPGPYTLRITARDVNSGLQMRSIREIDFPSFRDRGLQVSSLQLAKDIQVGNTDTVLYKNGRTVFPNVSHEFGTLCPDLCVYFEMYNLRSEPSADSIRVQYAITSGRDLVRSIVRSYRKPGDTAALTVLLPVQTLGQGEHTLTVTVSDRSGLREASASAPFFVAHSFYDLTQKDYDRVVRQLTYIASPAELRALRKAPRQEWGPRLTQFWLRRDPTPGTSQNEYLQEFYQRIRIANERFRTLTGEGWESDQGLVYVTLGPPDDITRYPFERGSAPAEVWDYLSLGESIVFVDEQGTGTYRLTEPFDRSRYGRLWPN
jgi:GWxTD domain-containing protein